MFQMKKNFNDGKSKKFEGDGIDRRVKKNSRVKKKSMISPSKILNYKQALRNRLAVKQNIYPRAMKTNIQSRNDSILHSPKVDANEETNQRLYNCNFLNNLFREKRPPNEPVLETPLGDAGQPSFCMDNNQSRMILNVTPSPQEIVVLSNSVKCCEADEEMYENLSQLSSTSMTKAVNEACMPSTDFTYYAPQQAQQILLYQEVSQIVKKTMIMEKVKNFGNFPDMVQELRNKLWETRSSRDENFDPDACSTVRCRTANAFYATSDNEDLGSNQYSPNLPSPVQDSNESKSPKSIDVDANMESPPFEFKFPDKLGIKRNLPDRMDSEDDNDEPKVIACRPRKSGNFRRKYQNSIFNSTLIPTCKLDQNLTMNPIEFLENASKVDNRDAYTYNDEFNAHQFAYSDSGIKVDDYKPPHRGPSNEWLSGTDMAEEQFHEVDELSNPKEYSRNDYRSNRNLQIPMKRQYESTKGEESKTSEMSKLEKNQLGVLSNSDYAFPSLVSSDTPEMKYYPCRLY